LTLPGSLRAVWKSVSLVLGDVVAAASGFWPFIKLISNLILWWTPPSTLSVHAQGLALRFLDATGKFVVTDTQMVILLMVAFHFRITLPGDNPTHVVDADVIVTPDIGVTTFVTATVISLLLSHYQLYAHRAARRSHTLPDVADGCAPLTMAASPPALGGPDCTVRPLTLSQPVCPPAELAELGAATPVARGVAAAWGVGALPAEVTETSLCSIHYDSLLCFGSRRLPRLMQVAIPVWLVVCGVAMVLGSGMYSFTITIEGLVGALVGADKSVHDWSIKSLASTIPSVTHLASPLLMRSLQIGFGLTCMVIPVVGVLLCSALWVLKLTPTSQHRLLVACEVCSAWAMLEVFAVILLTSLLSLDQFAKFSLGDECDSLNALLAQYPRLAHLVPGEATCLGIVPELRNGYYAFAAGALLAAPVCLFVEHAANVAFEERVARAHQRAGLVSPHLFTTVTSRSPTTMPTASHASPLLLPA